MYNFTDGLQLSSWWKKNSWRKNSSTLTKKWRGMDAKQQTTSEWSHFFLKNLPLFPMPVPTRLADRRDLVSAFHVNFLRTENKVASSEVTSLSFILLQEVTLRLSISFQQKITDDKPSIVSLEHPSSDKDLTLLLQINWNFKDLVSIQSKSWKIDACQWMSRTKSKHICILLSVITVNASFCLIEVQRLFGLVTQI